MIHATVESLKHPALERHYTCAEVAKRWGISEGAVYDIFREMPGVLRYCGGRESQKRARVTMRIPEHLVISTYETLVARRPDFFRRGRKTTGAAGSKKSSVAVAASRSL